MFPSTGIVAEHSAAGILVKTMPSRSIRVPLKIRQGDRDVSHDTWKRTVTDEAASAMPTAPVIDAGDGADAVAPGSRILLVDGHSMAYRAFFALPVENFATTSGQPTNAVYGFTSMLINLIRDEQPTHVFVAWDTSVPRSAPRPIPNTRAPGPSRTVQGPGALIKEVLDALRVPYVGVEGVEADDVLATLAYRCAERQD